MSSQNLITVMPATSAHWADIEELFASTPCWCQYWRMSASEYGRATRAELPQRIVERSNALRGQLDQATPPGVIAYVDGEIAGWCGIGPRTGIERLVRSRVIPQVDDRPVWSIVCFLVRVGCRRRGVARALLQGAVDCARSYDVPALEAYPDDSGAARINSSDGYMGRVSMFEAAGFQRVVETASTVAGFPRWVMRLEL